MEPRRVRALVLAAGLGTRLRPLSGAIPKPLFPVCGIPILGHTLGALARAGCEAAAINLHYLGGQIRDRFGDSFDGMRLVYSEEPEILGTLGALHPLRDFLWQADLVLLLNGDSLCRWPIARMIAAQSGRRSSRGSSETDPPLATLLLSRRADPTEFGGGVRVDLLGRVESFRADVPSSGRASNLESDSTRRGLVFAGAHAFLPSLLDRVAAGPADIVRDLYEPMLDEARRLGRPASPIAALSTGRVWHDLGTPRRYLDGLLDWVRAAGRGSWISPRATIEPGVRWRRTVVEAGARIGAGVHLEGAVILAGAEIGAGGAIRDSIVGPAARIAPSGHLGGQLAMPDVTGPATAGSARLTPLDGER